MENDNDDNPGNLLSAPQIVVCQEQDEEPIRLAVEETLLPSLQGEAASLGRRIVNRHGAYSLYAATEAVSSFLNRYLARNSTMTQLVIGNFCDAWILVGATGLDYVLTPEDVAMEVARCTDLWKSVDNKPYPAKSAIAMGMWMFRAMKYQPRLLKHFIATTSGNFPFGLVLTKVDHKDRIDDCRQRWRRSTSKQS